MELYHYRPVHTALKEIEHGTFRYSDREELNDPLEGYARIYWKGDVPAWEGLFRNYICSLYEAITLYLLAADHKTIRDRAVLSDVHAFDGIGEGKLLREAGDAFLQQPYLQEMIRLLAGQEEPVTGSFLRLVLRILHESAFSICMKSMKDHHLIPKEHEVHYIPFEQILAGTSERFQNASDAEKKAAVEAFAAVLEDMLEAKFLQEEWKEDGALSQKQTWLKLRLDFPLTYLERLQEMVYPKAYVVCFSADSSNSAMWGNYADCHRGVCLIYQAKTTERGQVMSVRTQEILSGKKVSWAFREDVLYPVQYEGVPVERNFFESLGRLNKNQLAAWLGEDPEKRSGLFAHYWDEGWREKYWKDYTDKYCKKLEAWKYEQEYRLMLTEFDHDLSPEERTISYEPAALTGVIFGIRTSEFDKRKILDAVRSSGRKLSELNFYQAEFDEESQKIKIRKKSFMSA